MDLSNLLLDFFELNQGDLVLKFKNGNRRNVHKLVLTHHSEVFKAMLNSGMKEAKDEAIDIPNFEEDNMIQVIRIMYGDISLLDKLNIIQMFETLRIIDYYRCTGMFRLVNRKLKKILNEENLLEFIGPCNDYPEVSNSIKKKLFRILKEKLVFVNKKSLTDFISDYYDREEQFADNCFDLLKNGQSDRINNAICCCKHKNLKQTFLVKKPVSDHGKICCINDEVKEVTSTTTTRLCCKHRTESPSESRINDIKKIKEELDHTIKEYKSTKELILKLPEDLRLEFFEYSFLKFDLK